MLNDKEIIADDNYIFQFILSKDYTFNSIDNNKRFKEELKTNNISLYTFIFDDDLKANKMKINLVQDQLYHLCIILLIFLCYFPIIGEWCK